MKKSVLSVLVALVMIFTLALSVFAAVVKDDTVSPCLTYIGGTDTTFKINTFSCEATGDMCGRNGTIKVKIKFQLQKNNDGVWETVETWEKTFNGVSGDLSVSKATAPFNTYRLKATYTAYTSSDSESLTAYRYGD